MATHLIGIMGKAGSGKDSFAARLVSHHGYRRLAFADPLKELAVSLDPILQLDASWGGHHIRLTEILSSMAGWHQAKQLPAVRQYLQNLGVSVRDYVGEDSWIRAVANRAAFVPGPVVVTDVRFHNEADWIQRAHGALVRIVRPGLDDRDGHVSENELNARVANHVIVNDKGLDSLHQTADLLAEQLIHEQARRLEHIEKIMPASMSVVL
jgi:hypothetical protein